MSDNIYSVSEIVGSSAEGIDDAIKVAIGRASKTLHNLDWFEVSDIRGRIGAILITIAGACKRPFRNLLSRPL